MVDHSALDAINTTFRWWRMVATSNEMIGRAMNQISNTISFKTYFCRPCRNGTWFWKTTCDRNRTNRKWEAPSKDQSVCSTVHSYFHSLRAVGEGLYRSLLPERLISPSTPAWSPWLSPIQEYVGHQPDNQSLLPSASHGPLGVTSATKRALGTSQADAISLRQHGEIRGEMVINDEQSSVKWWAVAASE